MLARWVSDICDPIQSQITGLPNHSINPPRTISATRPVCLAVRDIHLAIIVPANRRPCASVRESGAEEHAADNAEDLPQVQSPSARAGGALPRMRLPLSGAVEPQARGPRDGRGLSVVCDRHLDLAGRRLSTAINAIAATMVVIGAVLFFDPALAGGRLGGAAAVRRGRDGAVGAAPPTTGCGVDAELIAWVRDDLEAARAAQGRRARMRGSAAMPTAAPPRCRRLHRQGRCAVMAPRWRLWRGRVSVADLVQPVELGGAAA